MPTKPEHAAVYDAFSTAAYTAREQSNFADFVRVLASVPTPPGVRLRAFIEVDSAQRSIITFYMETIDACHSLPATVYAIHDTPEAPQEETASSLGVPIVSYARAIDVLDAHRVHRDPRPMTPGARALAWYLETAPGLESVVDVPTAQAYLDRVHVDALARGVKRFESQVFPEERVLQISVDAAVTFHLKPRNFTGSDNANQT